MGQVWDQDAAAVYSCAGLLVVTSFLTVPITQLIFRLFSDRIGFLGVVGEYAVAVVGRSCSLRPLFCPNLKCFDRVYTVSGLLL